MYQKMVIFNELLCNIQNNNKKYVKKKEKERRLPGNWQ